MTSSNGDTALTASEDNIHTRAWRRAGTPDPLILLVARERLLRASVKASWSSFTATLQDNSVDSSFLKPSVVTIGSSCCSISSAFNYISLISFGMTFRRLFRALVAHNGPAPAARLFLPCNPFPGMFYWRIRGSGSLPR